MKPPAKHKTKATHPIVTALEATPISSLPVTTVDTSLTIQLNDIPLNVLDFTYEAGVSQLGERYCHALLQVTKDQARTIRHMIDGDIFFTAATIRVAGDTLKQCRIIKIVCQAKTSNEVFYIEVGNIEFGMLEFI